MRTKQVRLKAEVLATRAALMATMLVVVAVGLLVPFSVYAGALPWDRGLNAIGSTLTGVVAAGVAVIAIAAAGLGSAVNADLGGATQKIVAVVIIMSMVGAAFILVGNLGLSGGLVP
jgi:type IV secretory pathway VirB2 component (pilin)